MSFFSRTVRIPQRVSGSVKLTPAVIADVDAMLSRRSRHCHDQSNTFWIPSAALEAVGVDDVRQLELDVVDGALVLRPRPEEQPDDA